MIKIYNDRMIYSSHRGKKYRIPTNKFLKYLDEYVELDKRTTLGTIVSLLYLNKEITNYIFHRTLGGIDIEEFFQDMNKPPDSDQKNDFKSEYLEVYEYPDIWKYKKTEKRFEYSNCLSLHLLKKEAKKDVAYSISFTKLCNLKKHPIKIKLDVDFFISDTTKKITKRTLTIPMLQTKLTGLRLYDFLWAILYEISWHGNPSDRDKFAEDLIKRAKDIENGNVKLIPWSEAIKKIKKRIPKKIIKKRK